MGSILVLLVGAGLACLLAVPAAATGACWPTCHASFCMFGPTVVEASVISSGPETTVLQVDRIHGIDDGLVSVGDVFETDHPWPDDIDGGIMAPSPAGHPRNILATRSGEVLCEWDSDLRVPIATAIDIALSDDCRAAAREVLGPETECNDTVAINDGCTSSPGATSTFALFFAFVLLAAARLGGSRARG